MKGELELQEKEKGRNEKEKFKAHGRIDKLYKDCDGMFRISGSAKVEYGEGKNKERKNLIFVGSVSKSKKFKN